MANSDKDLVITPNRGSSSADPKIVFSGASSTLGPQNITLQVYPTNSGTLSFEGSAGQLFSITNSLSGTIFSVNDVSGVPSIEVIDTGLVKLAQYGGNVLIGTGTDNGTNKLQVNGSISGTTFTSSVSTGTAPFTVSSTTKVSNLNADLLDGLDVHTGVNNEANKIVRTDGNGYIQAGWINTTSGDNGTTAIDRVYASGDGYIRYYTPANFRTVLDVPTRTGGSASGSWGINITGSSAYMASSDDRTKAPADDNSFSMRFGFTGWNNNGDTGATYADYLHLRSYNDSSGGLDNLVMFRKTGGIGMRIWQQAFGSATAYSNYRDVALITISDTAPTGYPTNLWWESDTGKLKIFYNDGSSSQWVDAVPIPDLTTYYSKAGGTITGPVVVNSSITTTGYVFAPRFVDVDSPGYYVDPAAATSMLVAGNVGIGTTSPSSRLHIYQTGLSDNTSTALLTIDGKFTAAGVDSNDIIGIAFRVENSGGGSQTTTCIASSYQASANALLLQPSAGNVGIGNTNPSEKLEVNGTVKATTFNSTSDRDLKENFVDIDGPIEKISKLRGYIYNFKSDVDKRRHVGVVAQDVLEALPEAVTHNGEAGYSVSYNDLVALLIEAVKEQNKTIESLQTTVDSLVNRYGV